MSSNNSFFKFTDLDYFLYRNLNRIVFSDLQGYYMWNQLQVYILQMYAEYFTIFEFSLFFFLVISVIPHCQVSLCSVPRSSFRRLYSDSGLLPESESQYFWTQHSRPFGLGPVAVVLSCFLLVQPSLCTPPCEDGLQLCRLHFSSVSAIPVSSVNGEATGRLQTWRRRRDLLLPVSSWFFWV